MTSGVRFFVSYARADKASQRLVASMKYALPREGHEVFADTDINLGVDWNDLLDSEIDNCDAFVLLLSAPAMRSDSFVHKELERVWKRIETTGKPLLIPVRTDQDVPLGDFADLQCLEWRSKNDTPKLMIDLQDAVAALDQRPTTPVIVRKPRRRIIVGIAAIVAVLVLILAFMNVRKLQRANTDEAMRDAYASTWFFRDSMAEKYWSKRGAAIEVEAAKKLKDQRSRVADQGLILAALASLKSGNALLDDARKEYDARRYERLITTLRFSEPITGEAFAASGNTIMAGANVLHCKSGWDCPSTKLDIGEYVKDAAFEDESSVYTVGESGRLVNWDLGVPSSPIGSVPLSNDATSVDTSNDRFVAGLDVEPFLMLQVNQKDTAEFTLGAVSDVAFGPCKTCVTVLTAQGSAAIWDYDTGQTTKLGEEAKGIAARAGRAVVVWNDGSVTFYPSQQRTQLYIRDLHSISLSIDGRAVIAHDGIVEIVDERGKSDTLVSASKLPAPDAALWLNNLILTRAPEDIRVWSSAATSVKRDVTPGERWREWRKKLGYTVDASGAVVIGTAGVKQLGWNRTASRIEEH